MYAYDDAIHGRMGKAEESKIFPVVHSTRKLESLIEGKQEIRIYANGLERQAEQFAEKIKVLGRNGEARQDGSTCRAFYGKKYTGPWVLFFYDDRRYFPSG